MYMVSHNLDWFGITLPTKPINKVEVRRKWVKIGKCPFWAKKQHYASFYKIIREMPIF